MKNFQIWESDFNQQSDRGGMLIPESEISQMVDCVGQDYYYITGLNVNLINSLNKAKKDWGIYNYDNLVEFLEEQDRTHGEIGHLSDSESPEEYLCFDMTEKLFFNLADCETTPWYQWSDNSNLKEEWAGENIGIIKVAVEDVKYLDLDEHDGNDWCTGGVRFYHEIVYRVVALDGSKVDNMYMLCQWSQYQGDHETAKILTQDELDAHLEEIGYKID